MASSADLTNGALFEPVRVGGLDLPHRAVMAPLTRSRSQQPGNIPTSLNACYYAQRASAALIISEATQVSQQGQGYAWTPGIHTADQVAGWQLVTDAVHEAGGRIVSQLWHVGRVSHPSLQPDGMLPVAPSPIAPSGEAFVEAENGGAALVSFLQPRALQLEEMPYVVQQFKRGAKNALAAGFDGVEVHAANGYLLDQFLNSNSNLRTDDYGGSVENRTRLLLEVLEAVGEVWGSDRVGVRLSPLGTFNDMGDQDPEATFGHVVERLNAYGLAYLHVVRRFKESEDGTQMEPEARSMMQLIRDAYKGRLMAAGGFDLDGAEELLRTGKADLIAFGRKFLANPDLPERFRLGADLNPDDPTTYYGGNEKGYTDYPTLDEEREGTEPIPCVDTRWR